MSEFYPIQTNFSGGEVSPLVYGNVDSPAYQLSSAVMRNFIPLTQGPAQTRGGFARVGDAPNVGPYMLMPIEMTDRLPIVALLTLNTFHLYTKDGEIVPNAPIVNPWSGLDYNELQFKKVPGALEIVFVHPELRPYTLTYDPDIAGNEWVLAPSPLTDQPPHWGPNNWPSAVGFHDGRGYFGGTTLQQERMDVSVAGDIYDFVTPGVPDATSAFFFDLPHPGRIRWIRSARELLIGTTQAVASITAQTVISVLDYQVDIQHGYGSSSGDTEVVSNTVMHIGGAGTRLYATEFREVSEGYIPDEMSEMAEHLMDIDDKLVRVAYQREPNEIIWGIKESGRELIGMAFKKRNGKTAVIAWHPHETRGTFYDIAVTSSIDGDLLFAVVERENGPSVEVFTPRSPIALDQTTIREYGVDTEVIDDLVHFNGIEVDVVREDLIEGSVRYAWLGKFTVTGGEIALTPEQAGLKYFVGLAFKPLLKTLPMTAGDAPGQGNVQGAFKGWSEISVRVVNSAAPLINGQAPADRTPSTPMDLSEPTKTDDFKVMNLGYDHLGQIEITQDVPFRTTISAIFGKADISNI